MSGYSDCEGQEKSVGIGTGTQILNIWIIMIFTITPLAFFLLMLKFGSILLSPRFCLYPPVSLSQTFTNFRMWLTAHLCQGAFHDYSPSQSRFHITSPHHRQLACSSSYLDQMSKQLLCKTISCLCAFGGREGVARWPAYLQAPRPAERNRKNFGLTGSQNITIARWCKKQGRRELDYAN